MQWDYNTISNCKTLNQMESLTTKAFKIKVTHLWRGINQKMKLMKRLWSLMNLHWKRYLRLKIIIWKWQNYIIIVTLKKETDKVSQETENLCQLGISKLQVPNNYSLISLLLLINRLLSPPSKGKKKPSSLVKFNKDQQHS